ncbi:MAG: hypothetical protein RRA92_04070 [Gemmatimonadota bacterium]|nr:hypothetical protein [Gemmatimonadota bacterium]
MTRRRAVRVRPVLLAAVIAAFVAVRPVPAQTAAERVRVPAPDAPVPLVVEADPWLADLAANLVGDARTWVRFPGIGPAAPGQQDRDTVRLYFVEDLTSLRTEGLARTEAWVAGTADPAGRRAAVRVRRPLEPLPRIRAVLRHELAHLFVHEASGGNAPLWLHEGYAQLVSGSWDWEDAWRLQVALFRGGAGTLEDVDLRFRARRGDPGLAYLLAYTAVRQMHADGGAAGLAAVFRELRGGATVEEAVRTVFGLTADAFERRWRSTLLDRYGWLYILSRAGLFWLAVTLLVLGVGVRRVRRDRARIEQMRAEEPPDLHVEGGSPPSVDSRTDVG